VPHRAQPDEVCSRARLAAVFSTRSALRGSHGSPSAVVNRSGSVGTAGGGADERSVVIRLMTRSPREVTDPSVLIGAGAASPRRS